MRKGFIKGIYCLLCLFPLILCGCADGGILAEKLQTAALEKEITRIQQAVDEESKPEMSFLYEGASCYAYQCLSEIEKIWYDNIAGCLGLMQEEIRLDKSGIEAGLDETDVDRIFQCVLVDHPELFYVEGYTYRKYTRKEELVAILFSGTYGMTGDEAEERKNRIEAQTAGLLREAAGLTEDYDKVKYVYETIIRNTEYDLGAADNQNIYSVFVNHKSVCQGYAKAVQYLLERMDVDCTLVLGAVDTGEGHAWNLVTVEGKDYYVDATWGDASYQSGGEASAGVEVPEISYDYLCITTEQLLRTHILDGYVSMPLCTDQADNYYVRENALFVSYDKAQMQNLFDRFYEEGDAQVALKCADRECFEQIRNALVDEQEVFDYLEAGSRRILYSHNEKQLSMTFWVTND